MDQPDSTSNLTILPAPAALERHYHVPEVARMWGLSENKVRHIFRNEPGVLQSKLRTLTPRKRQHIALRIPESVVLRVHNRLSVA